jgi:hypothetical protein
LYAGRVQSSALAAIGKDSAPSIIASQQIKTAIADMDADAANELLVPANAGQETRQAYRKRREEAATALIAAAQNITYGDAERLPILKIQLGLGTYETLVQRARDLHQEGNPGAVTAYNEAAKLLDSSILPAADALDAANLKELEAAYSGQRSRSLGARALAGGSMLVLLAMLISIQVFLISRTHRLLNIPLFAATCMVLVFGIATLKQLNSAERNLKRAKEDAFTSVHALWRARAVAYESNADESRFLLDPKRADEETAEFFSRRDQLAKLPPGASYDNAEKTPGFSGYLADELNNITFRGEGEAATETLRDFGQYVRIDADIRSLEHNGKHQQAIELCTGTAPGQSDWAFDAFDAALGRALKINQDAFDTSVAQGFAALRNFTAKISIFAAALAILCLLGLLLRIREYR